jgi:hypothetical protein
VPDDNLSVALNAIRQGLGSVPEKGVHPLFESLFGEPFHNRHFDPSPIRDAYALGTHDFSSPEQLIALGTMSTADRSTAPNRRTRRSTGLTVRRMASLSAGYSVPHGVNAGTREGAC